MTRATEKSAEYMGIVHLKKKQNLLSSYKRYVYTYMDIALILVYIH